MYDAYTLKCSIKAEPKEKKKKVLHVTVSKGKVLKYIEMIIEMASMWPLHEWKINAVCVCVCFSTVEALGIKELLPAYLDPTLQPKDLLTGVVIAAGGAGYDPLTAQVAVGTPI